MQTLVHIETDGGDWRDFTSRVTFDDLSRVTYKVGKDGRPILTPPGSLTVDNADGYWLTEPAAAGSDFSTGWNGRRLRISVAVAGEAPITIGVFRIAADEGLVARRDGWAELNLESLMENLKRGDASEVSHGRGWYTDLPWPLAIDKLRSPEDTSSLSLPGAAIPYEEERRSISSAGKPGDFRADGWHEMRGKAVDVAYNEETDRYAFLTAEGDIFELDATTGVYEQITVTANIPATYAALRIWWKRQSSGDGRYIIVAAANTAPSGWGGWTTKAKKGTDLSFFFHDQAAALWSFGDGDKCIAPAIIRENIKTKPDSTMGIVPNSDNNIHGMRAYGPEYYWWTDTDGNYMGVYQRREALIIPFDQYAYALETRNEDDYADVHGMEIFTLRPGHGWQGSPLNAFTPEDDNHWTLEARDDAGSLGSWAHVDLRAGAGYYQFVLLNDDDIWTDLDPDTWNKSNTGFCHYIGQGPMLDISFEHSGGASWDDKFWVAYLVYVRHQGYQLWCAFYDGSQVHATVVHQLEEHQLPTFAICDITRPSDNLGQRGAILMGYLHYDPQPNSEHEVGPNNSARGTCVMAESGVMVFPVTTVSGSDHPAFSSAGGAVVRFREFEGSVALDRHNQGESNPHISGRWTPLAMGFKRYLQDTVTLRQAHYNCVLSCIDRAELSPYTSGDYDFESDRAGTATYRLLYLHITVESSGGGEPWVQASGITDGRGPGIDIQSQSCLPWMGFSRILRGRDGDEGTHNTSEHVYAYNVSDRGLYRFACDSSAGFGKPLFVGLVPHSDMWMGPGTLAVGNDGGDLTKPVVVGVSWPNFPGSGFEPFPNGNYQGWVFGAFHMGRVGLLDNQDSDKVEAIGKVADLGDRIFLFSRDGVAQLKPYPDTSTDISLTIRAPQDVQAVSRSRSEIVNTVQLSVFDVQPGDISITRYSSPNSRFAAEPVVSGLGSYAVDLELKCILAGRPSNTPYTDDDDRNAWRSRALFGWRMNTARVKAKITTAASAGVAYLFVDSTEGIGMGDLLSLGLEDQDIRVAGVVESVSLIALDRALVNGYAAGDQAVIDPAVSGKWSHQLRYDETSDKYVGVAEISAGAAAGARTIRVSSLDPFAVGTLIRIHPKGTGWVQGEETPDYMDAYRVVRTRKVEGGASSYLELDIESVQDLGGLVEAVSAGDPITCYLNIPPTARSQRVGQTGIMIGLVGEGSTAEEDGEYPLLENDTIRVSYPGLVSKRNQHNRVTVTDSESQAANGTQKPRRRSTNKYADRELTQIMATRQVRRKAAGGNKVKPAGIIMCNRADFEALIGLEPYDVVRFFDGMLLQDIAGHYLDGIVLEHAYDLKTGAVDLLLEELDDSAPGDRKAGEAKTPLHVDMVVNSDYSENYIAWDKPEAADYDEVEIRWSTTGYPKHIEDGALLGVFSGSYITKHSSLSNGTTYYYTAFVRTTAGKVSAAAHGKGTPAADPAAITGLSVDNADKQVTLSWTDPTADDLAGIAIRYNTDGTYPSSITDGAGAGFAQAGLEAFTLTGLDNGRRYSFALFAIDYTGNIAGSATIDGDPDFDPEDYASVVANWSAHALRDACSDGDPIDSLADASTAGHDLQKYSDATRPTFVESDSDYNDLPVVRHQEASNQVLHAVDSFDGHDDEAGMMIFVVGEDNYGWGGDTFISRYGGGLNAWYIRGYYFACYDSISGNSLVQANHTTNTPHIICAVWYPEGNHGSGNGIARVFVDGVLVAEDDADAPHAIATGVAANIVVGGTYATGNGLEGRWGQMIICDEYVEGARKRIQEKLREKFATYAAVSLVSGYSRGYSRGYDALYPGYSNGYSSGYLAESA